MTKPAIPLLLTLASAAYAGTWRFTCDYFNLDTTGHLISRDRLSALYTRGLPGDAVRWSDVSVAHGNDWSDKFAPAEKQPFMEGFTYPYITSQKALQPDFFHGFPAQAMQERNLIWDTLMMEGFAVQLDNLKPNVPWSVPDVSELALAGAGMFRHRDLQLTLTGSVTRNGEQCAVIDYRAFFNTLDVQVPGVTLKGWSHYWGQIWVSKASKRIEYGTLYEVVVGEMTLGEQGKPQTMHVFRKGVFEPAAGN